jgi:phosphate-selective porin OprO/OprP
VKLRDSLALLPILLLASPATAADGAPPRDEKEPKPPEAIGPFLVKSPSKTSSLRFGFAAQLLYQLDSVDNGPDADRDVEHAFKLRRLRMSLSGVALTEDFSYALQLSTNPGNLELVDLYLNYRFTKDIQIRLGQFKIPFTRYRMMSFSRLTFVDWALVTKYFGAERQRGFAVHNGYTKQPRFAYVLGVFTGQNARASHGVGLAEAFGATVDNPSDLVDPAAMEAAHPEVGLHLSYNHGGIDTATDTDLKGGPLRFSAGVSGANDLRPDPIRDFSYRVAFEVLIKTHGLSVFAAFYSGFAARDGNHQDQQHAMLGMLAQLSYLVWSRLEFSGRYALVDIDDDLREQSRNSAEGQAGDLNREQELTFGVNVYIIGASLRWQNDLSWIYREGEDRNRDDLRFRSQLTLQF